MGQNDIGTSMLAAFASAFDQRDRLLRSSRAARELDDVLLPKRLMGHEALHACYRYALLFDQALATETLLASSKFQITLDDGAVREGTSDAQGLTELLGHEIARISRIEIPGVDD